MTTYTFCVKLKPIPGTHEHSYEATHVETGKVFALPQGGTDRHVGSYPEITDYLKRQGVRATVAYTIADKFEPDYTTGVYKWTYQRSGHVVIVNDISRTLLSIIGTS